MRATPKLRRSTLQSSVIAPWLIAALLLGGCASLFTDSKEKENAGVVLRSAFSHYQNREYNRAVEECQKALQFDPEFAPAYNQLALVYMETKRYQKAEETFNKALEIQPVYPEVFNNMGVLFNRQEKFPEAIAFFEKALSVEDYQTPENALTNLGYAHYRMGNLARAKAFHQKALDIVPLFCLASKNMGDVYAKEKSYRKAADYFDKAVTNCPLYQESQYKLGLALMKLGRRDVAKVELEKLVKKHGSGPYVDRSQEVLKYLQ